MVHQVLKDHLDRRASQESEETKDLLASLGTKAVRETLDLLDILEMPYADHHKCL